MPDDCLECTSMLCDNSNHALNIQQLHDDIISACIDASEDIPSTRKNNKIVPGWNEFVNPEKKTILWRKIWISNGSPSHGHVADIMRRTRAKCHYVILGYEPADLTVHPPPQNCRGWVHFFRIGV